MHLCKCPNLWIAPATIPTVSNLAGLISLCATRARFPPPHLVPLLASQSLTHHKTSRFTYSLVSLVDFACARRHADLHRGTQHRMAAEHKTCNKGTSEQDRDDTKDECRKTQITAQWVLTQCSVSMRAFVMCIVKAVQCIARVGDAA